MTCLTEIAHFLQDGGPPVYPIILLGLIAHVRLAFLRAWRGPNAGTPLRHRLAASTLGAFGSVILALAGYLWHVVTMPGSIVHATVPLIFYVLFDEALNVVYLGVGFAVLPTLVMCRIIFVELDGAGRSRARR